jgi:hypothetical protein
MKKGEPEAEGRGIWFPWRPRLDRQGRLDVAQVVAFFQRLCPEGKLKDSIAETAEQCGVSVRHVRAAWSEFEKIAVANVERVFQRPAAEKRLRGRPKGTKKLPGDYLLHLLELCRHRPAGTSLSQWCREIVDSVHLSDAKTFELIPISKSWRSLRSRLVEAQKIKRAANYRTRTFPNAPRGPLTVYGYSGTAPADLKQAIGWAGTTALHVPPLKARRKRVAALSKLFTSSETKLHK